MNIEQYQFISTLNTGITSMEMDLINYFKIDISKTPHEVNDELTKLLYIGEKRPLKKRYKIGNKWYKYDKNYFKLKYEQFSRLEMLTSTDPDGIKTLHQQLAVILRPVKYGRIEKYKLEKQDDIANSLLKMEMEDAKALLFFLLHSRSEFFNLYQYILFEPDDEPEYKNHPYYNQIKNIDDMFGWDIVIKNISNSISDYFNIQREMTVQDVFDYMVVIKQANKIEKYKSSKSTLPL